jgi:hypothetical protein
MTRLFALILLPKWHKILALEPQNGGKRRWTLSNGNLLMPMLSSSQAVVSTGAKFVEQTWTGVVLSALDQSDLPAFLLYSGRLARPAHVRERTQAGTCPRWTNDSPTTLTCMHVCIRAWPASLCRGVPLTGFSHPTCSRTGRVLTKPALTALPCRETENLSVSYMRSILHQQDRLVKGLGSSSSINGH